MIFARWDYIDRDAVTHQNLWAMQPDGTNPVAVWGNAAPKPHCMFQAKAIPDSGKFVFIASAHHSIADGPVCVVDSTVDAKCLSCHGDVTANNFAENRFRCLASNEGGPNHDPHRQKTSLGSRRRPVFFSNRPEENSDIDRKGFFSYYSEIGVCGFCSFYPNGKK